ncbi:MAG: MBL fold metallo-hydrolase, partial [Lachnospiraceae bacterium]|nr:MBL fold metallo-hydrolase [Lachnospiraceae bacterium]
AYAAEKLVLENTEQNVSSEVGMPCTVKADEYLEDGASVSLADMTFTLIATPGHTMGSACYYFAAQGILFSGDTLFEQSVGRTDLPTGNMGTLTKSIREKLFILPEHVKVYPGHGEPTSIGSEKENNPFV